VLKGEKDGKGAKDGDGDRGGEKAMGDDCVGESSGDEIIEE